MRQSAGHSPPRARRGPHAARAPHSAQFRTQLECLRHLISLAGGASLSMGGGAVLVAFWLHELVARAYLLPWLIAMLVCATLRLAFAHRVARALNNAGKARLVRLEKQYAILAGASGALWGLSAWLPMADPEYSRLFALSAILFCVLLMSSSTLVASRLAFTAFASALVAPLVARLITLDSRLTVLLGFGVLALCGLVFTSFRAHRRTLVSALNSRHRSEDLLQQQRVIFESAGEGIVLLKPKPRYVADCNRRFAELFGYPLAAMPGMEPWRWHPDRGQWKALIASSQPAIASGRPYSEALQLKRADGTLFWGEVTGMAVDPDDLRAGTVWIVSDVSEKRAVEAALAVSEARFRDLIRLSSDLYWEQDAEFRYTHFDGPEAITSHIPIAELIGRTRWELSRVVGVPEARWKEHTEALERHEPFRDFIYQMTSPAGVARWYSINGNPMFDADGVFVGYHGTASDITSRIETESRFRHLAYHDPLTQLPNRRLLEDRLEQAIRSARRNEQQLALLLIDLDRFKPINDRYGHAVGDRVLETIAERLRACVRETDTVARLGGDEFVVLLSSVEMQEDATLVADKIHACITEPIAAGEHLHRVGSSIGISLYPQHGDTPETLLHRADHAMYHGKQHGGRTTRLYDEHTLN
ncbi:MAG: hypothetical protein C0466_00480 [Candidatus Accumulibacter sp.]|nr:hypothetical protein [Accumulibacter sp.]